MSTVELTAETFEPTVTGDGIVLVDIWAEWCGPCKQFAPIYDAAATENPDIVFGKVDSEANPELSAALGVQAIPTLMVFRDGIGLFQQAGALPKPALDSLIAQARALDMDQVRAAVAEQQQAQPGDA
ncbi:thioredoxin family protein [Microbacterium stercoris]|uniref:Thioredoxin family protein n=1 Tax=Microbacterium stercoris TaxID=2820289 RepID=A0A939QM31_9MICO|nr:thioredoxin family protein [Microbacterium stercoris]MBO3664212.1 thioredoxin family protein [Microbacterium stercoris]